MSEDDSSSFHSPEHQEKRADRRGHEKPRSWLERISSALSGEPTTREDLVELLRDRLALTGTKIGCDRGECGACTVLMGGKPIYSCSNLAVWADGKSITTVEGLAVNGRLSAVQQAFIDKDAPQCGFCTSGQLMAATALLAANPRPTASDARAAMVGNICRCAGYNHYVEAVLAAAGTGARSTGAVCAERRNHPAASTFPRTTTWGLPTTPP